MNAICKPCKRVFAMRRLLKRHRCPECSGELVAASLHATSRSSSDGWTWYRVRDNPGYKVGVVTVTLLRPDGGEHGTINKNKHNKT